MTSRHLFTRISPMRSGKRSARSLWRVVLLACLLALPVSSVWAAPKKAAEPDPSVNPALAALQKAGAKFFYLGRYASLDGWFVVKDGQVQIIYKPTNNAFAMVGYLFAANGDNVTAGQVKHLTETNAELAAMAATTNDLPTQTAAAGVPVATTASPADTTPVADLLLPTGERLLKDLGKMSSVTLGANESAPILSVLIAPDCAVCKKFWLDFREPVQAGKLRLRLYPASPRDTDHERVAAQLLHATDPLAAWDKYMGGDKTALAGAADPADLEHIRATVGLIERWKIPTIPYLVYKAKNGDVKVVKSAPNKPQLILDDLPLPEVKP